jgi:hypothetical protein
MLWHSYRPQLCLHRHVFGVGNGALVSTVRRLGCIGRPIAAAALANSAASSGGPVLSRLTPPPGGKAAIRPSRCATVAHKVPPFGPKESILWVSVGYDFRTWLLHWLDSGMGAERGSSVVSGLEGGARSDLRQNKFRSHQPIAPSQSAWAVPPKTTYTMTPSGVRGSRSVSAGDPVVADNSTSAAT